MKKIFTLCVALVLTLTVTAGQNKSTRYPEWFSNNSEWNKVENTLRVDPDYSTNYLSNYTAATLPYTGDAIITNSSETIKIPSFDGEEFPATGFTFNLTQKTGVKISFTGDNVCCILSSSRTLTEESELNEIYAMGGGPVYSTSHTTGALEAGEYTLFVISMGPGSATITIETAEPEPSYTDVDYSKTIKLGEPVYGMLDDNHGTVISPILGAPFNFIANGYNFEAKKNKTYTVNIEGEYETIFLLKGGDLKGSVSTDIVDAFFHTFTVPADGTYRLLIVGKEEKSYIYKMTIEEVIYPDITFQEITLPYHNDVISFDDDKTFEYYDSSEGHNTKARGFKFTLTEDANVTFSSKNNELGWTAYRAIYASYSKEEGFGEMIDYNSYSQNSINLAAGTYYLVVDDDDYTNENGGVYYCFLDIKLNGTSAAENAPSEEIPNQSQENSITLKEVLDNATVITYSDDLSYLDTGSTLPTLCNEVLNDEEYERLAYCAAYKITLSDGDKITINHHASNDAFLLVYTKDSEGEYVLYAADDDGGISSDSEIVLSISEDGDAEGTYYIVATTYRNLSNESYIFTILGKNGVEQELQFTAIASDVESLTVEDINNSAEILFKLADLEIYGLINGTSSKLPLGNGLDYWEISEDNTTATYLPDTDNEAYPFAENIDDLVITIKQHVSGINHVSKESKVLVYGANGDINVHGTEGGESIVVYNIYGSIVTRTVATGDLTTINVSNGGIYIVRVGNKGFKVVL
ncbi:MAG: hypothetical protein IJ270_03455 [Paludibacteraceae bacterium]|nr:hypothetical protein [Paludibacteraceae bacterium]